MSYKVPATKMLLRKRVEVSFTQSGTEICYMKSVT